MDPVRTCLGCRRRAPASSLVRFVGRDGRVVPDASGAMTGRGAWVHPTVECVESSLRRRAFGRALRENGVLDTSGLQQYVLSLNQSVSPDEAPR
ncbi:hypothetical protein FB562_1556 [Homoserinimonas aerilata]|uniref:YlxR domain-containing protein n=1 Tax=Homoserinimonas aerilata TaxID=1162970 RepID=A0A542YK69_9MICO|nr:YlxR family protein [Homoserinimonas aerilata]TQL48462.1 hypothetical protein FB562_1556 [Homoserinimonas aerilata]